MANIIIGTAGHVDHGKTQLVKALTGKDTDRLKEEKERGISIELGFAPLQLPDGQIAGIVDVPGHERFIKHMLAGVGGIDLVLLVIAADEGIMPQTREHLDIIQLLQIPRGIVVLTKADLVDEEWLELVKDEIQQALTGTILEQAPVLSVSSVTGQGIQELLQEIQLTAGFVPEKGQGGKARMPIDRVFTITGFGTVVTGTLLAGQFKVGEEVVIVPQGLTSKIRTIQVHGKKCEKAVGGQRSAINLAGIEVDQVERGSTLTIPGALPVSYRLDLFLELLKTAEKPLENRARIRFHLGTKETFGRITLLDREELAPGESALAQIILEEPVASAKKDRYVVRSYSPMVTIGGGFIIDSNPPKRKRFKQEVLDELTTKMEGTPDELLMQYLEEQKNNLKTKAELAKTLGLSQDETGDIVTNLVQSGALKVISGDKEYVVTTETYNNWADEIKSLLEAYHREFPLRAGIPKEDLRSRKFAFLGTKLFNYLFLAYTDEGILKSSGPLGAVADFEPTPSTREAGLINKILADYSEGGNQPPGWKELVESMKLNHQEAGEYLAYLINRGQLVKIDEDIYFPAETLGIAKEKLISFLREQGNITLGQFRDLLGTSRKYGLPLLEYFDREKVTKRTGDVRVSF